jgi:hypothetical protein
MPPPSAPRFTFAAIGVTSLGIIFGTLDATSPPPVVRLQQEPMIQPLCAAFIVSVMAAAASRFVLSVFLQLSWDWRWRCRAI